MYSFSMLLMASHSAPDLPLIVPIEGEDADELRKGSFGGLSSEPRHWRKRGKLSSISGFVERFLTGAGFDRAPWLTVVFGLGIVSWFALKSPWQWSTAIGLGLLVALTGASLLRSAEAALDLERPHLRAALIALGLIFAMGVAVIWVRSEVVGAGAIDRPMVERVQGHVLEREDQPARDRVRLVMAVRDASTGTARKIRVNVPLEEIGEGMAEGAVLNMRVRLMPPAPPMLPGGYDFARAAWFKGYAGTGSVIGEIEVVRASTSDSGLPAIQRFLSRHVRGELSGSPGSIAAAFASGDRGGISEADEEAMRDSGLTHLLSISGLHVSAVIAAGYLIAIKLLALWPWLVLRVRLPVVAAGIGALAGIGYTLLTGAEVPTVRSCVGAVLVLIALAVGRDALSIRMVAVAAFFVMLFWPESLIGPSFQMSFAAVISIVALHNCGPVQSFLAPRDESWLTHVGRRAFMLLATGFVIEIALMPIVLFHFHRAGVYGALANVVAIPLVTFISMPMIAVALLFDLIGLGAPFWWIAGKSLELLIWIAHTTAAQPGAVNLMPQMSWLNFALFLRGSLWLALWRGRYRLFGFLPAAIATLMMRATPIPDVLISNDWRNVGITMKDAASGDTQLLSLRDSRSSYTRDNLLELASVESEPIPLADWEGAECSNEFCVLTIERGGRDWSLMMARNRDLVEERALAAACERSDIVIADRWLPSSCKPRWLKADRNLLERTGGLAITLEDERIITVSSGQGEHGWWRGEPINSYRR
ncbi:MAG: ComEC/Rec2 family competence protein [Erythrobacter sp.]